MSHWLELKHGKMCTTEAGARAAEAPLLPTILQGDTEAARTALITGLNSLVNTLGGGGVMAVVVDNLCNYSPKFAGVRRNLRE